MMDGALQMTGSHENILLLLFIVFFIAWVMISHIQATESELLQLLGRCPIIVVFATESTEIIIITAFSEQKGLFS